MAAQRKTREGFSNPGGPGGVEQRLGDVERRQGDVERRLGGLERRQGDVERRLGVVEGDIKEIKVHISYLATKEDLLTQMNRLLRWIIGGMGAMLAMGIGAVITSIVQLLAVPG